MPSTPIGMMLKFLVFGVLVGVPLGAGPRDTLKLWASNNVTAMYKTVAAPVLIILSAFRTVTQGLVQVLYNLCPSIWSSVSKLQHKIVVVERLMDKETLEFIYGRVHKLPNGQDICYPFEHKAIINVVLNATFLTGYAQFVLLKGMDSFNNLMAMGACTVLCCLQEFTPGSHHSINFAAAIFKSWYNKFMGFISMMIRETSQLWDRWVNLHTQMLRRGCLIGGLDDINISVL
ncbi:uncharacterized protein BJ212DRAFT_1297347 [Suillus subaureus]|uniref:DUF6532 domain-containing protein n=1 Tax=Suillus subaureus TaxID=48587 RepID=A0A9P7JGI1_9AGAM|nr:uncharacterized protein BJ212DRAFT_1297347 [Suillus subaureus]KAG1820844.1 hypothetical protein BJ212DRAFT_1297347 [Suillus subaureus]